MLQISKSVHCTHDFIQLSLLIFQTKDANGSSQSLLYQKEKIYKNKMTETSTENIKNFENFKWISQKISKIRSIKTLKLQFNIRIQVLMHILKNLVDYITELLKHAYSCLT